MASKNSVYVYRLSDKGRKMGLHTIAAPADQDGPGVQYKVDKNGIVRIPHPGLPHADAHHLEHVSTEGDGSVEFINSDLAESHQKVAEAEAALKDAQGVLDEAKKSVKDKKEAEAVVEAAALAVAEAKKAVPSL